jgi:hypothetical protein
MVQCLAIAELVHPSMGNQIRSLIGANFALWAQTWSQCSLTARSTTAHHLRAPTTYCNVGAPAAPPSWHLPPTLLLSRPVTIQGCNTCKLKHSFAVAADYGRKIECTRKKIVLPLSKN